MLLPSSWLPKLLSQSDFVDAIAIFAISDDSFVPHLLEECLNGLCKIVVKGPELLIRNVEIHRWRFDKLSVPVIQVLQHPAAASNGFSQIFLPFRAYYTRNLEYFIKNIWNIEIKITYLL